MAPKKRFGRLTWPNRDSKAHRRLVAGTATLLSILIFLMLIEGVARIAGEPPNSMAEADDPAALHRQAMVNGWALTPSMGVVKDCNYYQRAVLKGASDQAHGEVPISPQGFRDTPLSAPKPAGQTRILFLGDSSVFGDNICRLDTLPERLEAALNELGEGPLPDGERRFEVINAGVPGYSTYQSLELLRRAERYEPDGVIVYNMISDWDGPAHAGTDAWFSTWAVALRVLSRSAAVRWADFFVTPAVDGVFRPRPEDVVPGEETNRVHLSNYIENLRRIATEAAAMDAWVAFVIPPQFSDVAEVKKGERPPRRFKLGDYTRIEDLRRLIEVRLGQMEGVERTDFQPEDYHAAMALVAMEGDHPVLGGPDLIRAAARKGGCREQMKPNSLILDHCHPGPVGNRILAEALTPMIAPLVIP